MNNLRYYKKITRVFNIPFYEEGKHKHTLYCFPGKMGTHATTWLWFVDELPEPGKLCTYLCEEDGINPDAKNFGTVVLSNGGMFIHHGECNEIRSGIPTDPHYILVSC